MYGRSSINSVAGGSDCGGDDGVPDMGGRAQSLVSSSSNTSSSIGGGGCDSSTSSTSSLVESGPRSSRDVRRSISSSNQKTGNGSSCNSSVDSRILGPRIVGSPSSELYDQNILKNRASVLSQLSSVFGQRINSSSNSNSVQQRQKVHGEKKILKSIYIGI